MEDEDEGKKKAEKREARGKVDERRLTSEKRDD